MNTATLIDLYNTSKFWNAKRLDHNRKATWLDCRRDPNAAYYCMKAEETNQEFIRRNNEWLAAIKDLSGDEIVAIILEAEGAAH